MTEYKRFKRHKLAWCDDCGWVHAFVKPMRVKDGDVITTISLCKDCIDKCEQNVKCHNCGITTGTSLFYATFRRRELDDEVTSCNIVIPLCDKCNKSYQESIDISVDICDNCSERFKCFTQQPEKMWWRFIPKKNKKRNRNPNFRYK